MGVNRNIPRTPQEIDERRLDELVEHTVRSHGLVPVSSNDIYRNRFEKNKAACEEALQGIARRWDNQLLATLLYERSQGKDYTPLRNFFEETARRLDPDINAPPVYSRSEASTPNDIYDFRRSD